MTATYNGSLTGIVARETASITEMTDSDIRNAASVTTPLRKLTNYHQFLMQKAALLDVVNAFTAIVQLATGSGLELTAAALQSILKKTSGGLDIGTAVATDVRVLLNNVVRWTFRQSDGALVSAGMALTGLPTPVSGSDAATKTYADARETAANAHTDGKFPALSWSAPSLNANWSNGTTTPGYWLDAAGVVHLKGRVTWATGGGNTAFTLPAGYRPAAFRTFAIRDQSTTDGVVGVDVDSSGNVIIPTRVNGHSYDLSSISFVAEQ